MKRILIILLIVLPIYILSCPVKAEIESSFNEYSSVLLVADVESGAMIDANQAAIDFYGFSREILISINGNHALSPISIVNDKGSRKQLKETLRVRTVIFYIVLSIFAMLQFIVILMLARGLKANKKIHKTLTEIKDKYLSISENTHEELICTAKQLAALNKLRDKLFTDVVHDIRNPIATMVSMMEVLEEDYCSSDSREIVREVRKQVKSTFSMVENLLECVNIQNDMVINNLEFFGLESSYLELEITESILMESYESIVTKLEKLKEMGVRIALDDFGKGYSSLSYLKQLPISTLKIDKSFIDDITSENISKTIAGQIILLGKSMGMYVVAEGVERQEQLEYLVKHECHTIQGYLCSKPIPESEVEKLLEMS